MLTNFYLTMLIIFAIFEEGGQTFKSYREGHEQGQQATQITAPVHDREVNSLTGSRTMKKLAEVAH